MVPDPARVEGDDLVGDADAFDVDVDGPRVEGEFGGEVAGEVAHILGIPGEPEDGGVLQIQQPPVMVVAFADGDQLRVGGLHRRIQRPHLVEVDVDG